MLFSLLLATGLAHAYTVTIVDQFMFKNIDPLVYPGQYVSHMHSFFGSDAVNVNTSISAQLREGCFTAENPNDFSVYCRYPIPEDFQVVVGNASASSPEHLTEDNGVSWACEGDDAEEGKEPAAFPTRTCSTHLQNLLFFLDCANPETFETAYSKNPDWYEGYGENRCPEGMYRIPRLRFSIRYSLRDILPDGWEGEPPLELACGNSYCSYGDFINGWLTEVAKYMLEDPSKSEYFQVNGPLGTGVEGTACDRTAKDNDPGRGTDDFLESLKMMEKEVDAKTRHKRHHHPAAHRRV